MDQPGPSSNDAQNDNREPSDQSAACEPDPPQPPPTRGGLGGIRLAGAFWLPRSRQKGQEPLARASQQNRQAGIGRQQIIGALEFGERQHSHHGGQPDSPQPRFAISSPAAAKQPGQRRNDQETPGQGVDQQPGAVIPPGMNRQFASAAHRPLKIVIPEEDAEEFAMGFRVRHDEPRRRDRQAQRNAPEHRSQRRRPLAGEPLHNVEADQRRERQHESNRPLEQHPRRHRDIADETPTPTHGDGNHRDRRAECQRHVDAGGARQPGEMLGGGEHGRGEQRRRRPPAPR